MKRRLTIARSLINEPDLLLLDEPTTGLDPQARHLLWDRLYRLKQRGVTLVLTTHYMDEAEQLCDRLVVMDKAKIVAEGSPRELIERYSTREVTELRFPVGVQETLDGQLDGLAERDRAPAGPRPALRRRRRGGGRGRPRARAPAGDRARPAVDPRGRLPAADRPVPDRVSAGRADAMPTAGDSCRTSLEHRAAVPADVPRRRIFTSFLSPGPVPARDGPRAGQLRRPVGGARAPSAGALPRSSSRPGLLAATAMQAAAFEATFPIMAGLDLAADVPRDVRDADLAARHRRSATSPGSRSG